jgi:glycosyltransferase involved in cell wall biosynthesis
LAAPSRRIVLSANSDWNIVNFRGGLLRGLRSAGYEPVVIAPQDPIEDNRMQDLQVERISVKLDRSGANPFVDLGLMGTYRELLRKLQPAAYLGFTIKPNIYGSRAAARLGVPAIPNVSGLGTAFIAGGPMQRIVTSLYRWGFRRAPVVFFQNDEDRDLFVERRIVLPQRARVLPGSGVDLARFSPAPAIAGPPTFLLVGRLLRDKGVVEFVEGARKVRSHCPAARFQLLGPIDEGNRTAVDRRCLAAWQAEGIVEYLGVTDDVRPFIAEASAVVLPSYREGLPRSLLEAAAMARPLIATDVPGCRAVVEDGHNGYLSAVRNPASLAEAMLRFANLPDDERQAMGEAARRAVERDFGQDRVIAAYLEALAEVAPSGPVL